MTTTSTDGPSLALFFYLWSLQLLENYWEVAFIVDVVERLAQVGYPWYFTISTQHSCKSQKCVGFCFLFGNLVIFFSWNQYYQCKRCFHEIFTKKWWDAQCGNYGNLLSRIFGKNFVKVTVLLRKLLKSWFDGNFWAWSRVLVLFHTVHW